MAAFTSFVLVLSASIAWMAASVTMRLAVPLYFGSTLSEDDAATGEMAEKALPGALAARTETLSQTEPALAGDAATLASMAFMSGPVKTFSAAAVTGREILAAPTSVFTLPLASL